MINVDNFTLIEFNSSYSSIFEEMEKDQIISDWVLPTSLTVENETGVAMFKLEFRKNKDIYVFSYIPSNKQALYTQDISDLTSWAQEKGWNVPKVADFMVKENLDLWKYFWETGVVDSDYLSKRFGNRSEIGFDESIFEEEEGEFVDDEDKLSDN